MNKNEAASECNARMLEEDARRYERNEAAIKDVRNLQEGISVIAALVPNGELVSRTDSVGFMKLVAHELLRRQEELDRAERVVHELRDFIREQEARWKE